MANIPSTIFKWVNFLKKEEKFYFQKKGKYFIRPTNPSYFHPDHRLINCEIVWSKGKQCDGTLVLYGFDISGAIYNENQPFGNFIISLKPHP